MGFKQAYLSIWQEIWNLHKKYAFISKDDIPKWENLTMEASRIHDKYSNSVGAKFVISSNSFLHPSTSVNK